MINDQNNYQNMIKHDQEIIENDQERIENDQEMIENDQKSNGALIMGPKKHVRGDFKSIGSYIQYAALSKLIGKLPSSQ